MGEIKKFRPDIEKEYTPEKESKPEKTILFIRHPSVKWLDMHLKKAELEGKDIETYTLADIKGLKMTRLLSEYLQKKLPEILKEENLNKKFMIYTSPIRRSKSEANIISKNLNLAHLENQKVPIPANNIPIELECFSEIPWIGKKQEALDLLKEAKQKNIHPIKLWLQKDPDKIIDLLNSQLSKVKQGLQFLNSSKYPFNIVFTHRLILGLTLWFIEEKNKGKKDLTITQKDLPKIIDLVGKIAYTSISEISRKKNQWNITSIAETPHLEKNSKIEKGTY